MSTRNSDASQLTKEKRNRNEAAFFNRTQLQINAAQNGVFVQGVNPQSGVYDASKFGEITPGSMNTFYRANPATIISLSPTYLDISGNEPRPAQSNYNVPFYQPINDNSPR
jgi:hypothetical protein